MTPFSLGTRPNHLAGITIKFFLASWFFALPHFALAKSKPLALHPANPHYFLFHGKPTVLITSGEHYGAILNLDFDYVAYLEAIKQDSLNLTRTFSGAYVEPLGAFKIARAVARSFYLPVGQKRHTRLRQRR